MRTHWKAVGMIFGVLALATTLVVSRAGTGQAINRVNPYPYLGPPVGIVGGQEAVITLHNIATQTCKATLEFTSSRGAVIVSRTLSVPPGAMGPLGYAPPAASGRVTLGPVVLGLNGTCPSFFASTQIVDVRSQRTLLVAAFGDPEG